MQDCAPHTCLATRPPILPAPRVPLRLRLGGCRDGPPDRTKFHGCVRGGMAVILLHVQGRHRLLNQAPLSHPAARSKKPSESNHQRATPARARLPGSRGLLSSAYGPQIGKGWCRRTLFALRLFFVAARHAQSKPTCVNPCASAPAHAPGNASEISCGHTCTGWHKIEEGRRVHTVSRAGS